MQLTRRCASATLLVAAILVPYVGYLVRTEMPLVQDAGGRAATGVILGLLAFAIVGRSALGSGALTWAGVAIGIAAIGLGVAAVWAESNELLLGAFIATIVVLWALETLSHTGASCGTREFGTGASVNQVARSKSLLRERLGWGIKLS